MSDTKRDPADLLASLKIDNEKEDTSEVSTKETVKSQPEKTADSIKPAEKLVPKVEEKKTKQEDSNLISSEYEVKVKLADPG